MAETSEMAREARISDEELTRLYRASGHLDIGMVLCIRIRERLRAAGFDLEPINDADYGDPRISGRWEYWRDEARRCRVFRQYPSPG